MKIATTPQLTIQHTGQRLKVLHVTGDEGMSMPEHFSSKEAVLITQKGSAVLTMDGQNYPLIPQETMIIPAGKKHSLYISSAFEAQVITEAESEIRFVNQ